MIAFVKGIVVKRGHDAVILDHQGIGFRIFTPDPLQYAEGEELLLHTYHHVREDAILLYGFKDLESYDLFLRLIDVKGLGCKSALNMLSVGRASRIIEAIENGDVAFLKGCPGIGAKTASQIILDLKGKLISQASKQEEIVDQNLLDAHDALLALGYKESEIRSVLKEVVKHDYKDTDGAIRLALSYLLKRM